MMYYNLFYELIQVAIGRRVSLSRVPSAKDWSRLYALAEKQAVAGVCFCGVQRLPEEQRACLPDSLKMQWLALAAQTQARNELMNRKCVEVQRMLAEEGMKSCILKGQGVAELYEISNEELGIRNDSLGMLRQSGDIDVYVPCGMEKAMAFARKKYGKVEYDYINAHVPMFKEVDVELHWRVGQMTNLFRNRRLQRWLKKEDTKKMILGGKAVLPECGEITVPTPDFNAFYLMLHCYHHMFSSGLGLRQLMDYYFLLMARNELNPYVNRMFKEFGMERFVGAVMWIMLEVFGLERERLLCEPYEKEGRYILAEVMAGGNFGHHDKRIRKVGKGKWQSVFANLQHAMHVLRRYPQEAIWMPVWMVYHFIWKRTLKIK